MVNTISFLKKVRNALLAMFFMYVSFYGDALFGSSKDFSGLLSLRENVGSNIALRNGYGSLTYLGQFNKYDFQLLNDFRMHYLGKADWAMNLGVGMRIPNLNSIIGFNVFYDWLKDKRTYHQIGLGGEILGNWIDIRYNIYMPVGKKTHTLKSCHFKYPGGFTVDFFKRRAGTYGFDIECAKRFNMWNNFELYAAIGGYGYSPHHSKEFAGVRTRITCDLWKLFSVGAVFTYDCVSNTSLQGFLSISIKFSSNGIEFSDQNSLSPESALNIYRQELIVREKKYCIWKTNY